MFGIGLARISLLTGSSLGGGAGVSATLDLNFRGQGYSAAMAGYTFNQLISFTRTSAATYVNSAGNIVTTPASKNLLTFTEEFDNAAWAKTNSTITANSTAAPDGTMTADTLTAGAGAGSGQQIYQALTTIGAGSFVYSVYVKQGSGATDSNKFVVYNQTASLTFASITVDYSTGVVTQTVGTGATMTAVGNGWWRVVIPFTSTATLGNSIRFFVGSSGSVETPGEFIYAWGAQVESGSAPTDYTRNFGGLFPPRFDYDPVTRAPRGLLIEEQRTNLLLRSEEFDNAAWSKINGSITANATTSPDGTVDADLFVPNTTGGVQHRIDQTPVSSAVAQVFSVFVKASGYTWISLRVGTVGRAFDIANGIVGTAGTMTGTITSFGNGWYRCAIAVPSPLANDVCRVNVENGDSVASVFAGDGTRGIFIYGAQLEAGSFATSYIPTVASQVTRTADQASIVAPNFATWYNQSEGTFVVEADGIADASRFTNFIRADDGTTSNRMAVYQNGSLTQIGFDVTTGGVAQANTIGSVASVGNVNKIAAAYKANDFAISANGGAVVTDVSGTVPSGINVLRFGRDTTGSSSTILDGHIRSIRYYPSRLGNSQLQALTA
jgi:hypothetical protein